MLSPWIISHLAAHKVYVEPFGGSAAVLLRKPRSYGEVYNDMDGDVVTVFQVLRDPALADRLQQAVALTPFSRAEFAACADMSGINDPVELSRRFLVRSLQGFGSNSVHQSSGFRACTKRDGSIPVHDWVRWPSRVPALTERLRGVVIENRDYEAVMSAHDGADTLHYVDPPYVLDARCKKNTYHHDFENIDHARLSACLHDMTGMVVLSGYQSALYETLFADWQRVDCETMADGARPRTESLWLNDLAWESRPDAAQPQQVEMFAGEAV